MRRVTQAGTALGDMLRPDAVRAFYLSVSPSLFGAIASKLNTHGSATPDSRIVVEKPFGHDLATRPRRLNADLRRSFDEHQIYRIDHYLGKETVQNLMALRFANSLWEPLWNATHVDHVQITVAESLGVDGRGEYYDRSGRHARYGAEPPDAAVVPDGDGAALTVHPQCGAGRKAQGDRGAGAGGAIRYRARTVSRPGRRRRLSRSCGRPQDAAPKALSRMKVNIGNWRWAGTPFYLRTGKKLRARTSEIAIVFRDPPHMIFPEVEDRRGNALIIRLQPDEGITLRNTIKEPGPGGFRLAEVNAGHDLCRCARRTCRATGRL